MLEIHLSSYINSMVRKPTYNTENDFILPYYRQGLLRPVKNLTITLIGNEVTITYFYVIKIINTGRNASPAVG